MLNASFKADIAVHQPWQVDVHYDPMTIGKNGFELCCLAIADIYSDITFLVGVAAACRDKYALPPFRG